MGEWRIIVEVFIVAAALIGAMVFSYAVLAQARRMEPSSWQEMEDRFDRQQKRFDRQGAQIEAQAKRIDELQEEIDDLREARTADNELLQAWISYAQSWITYARELAAKFKEMTGQEAPPEPVLKHQSAPGRASLSRFISQRFSVEEIDGLAFDLGLAADELGGGTRTARARALTQWAADRGMLEELRRRVEEARPVHL